MKKILALLLTLALVFSFVACNNQKEDSQNTDSSTQTQSENTVTVSENNSTDKNDDNSESDTSNKNSVNSESSQTTSSEKTTSSNKTSKPTTSSKPNSTSSTSSIQDSPSASSKPTTSADNSSSNISTNSQPSSKIKYTVIYDANGGWGETSSSNHTYNESRALSKNGFKKAGFSFVGWSTNPNATSADYTNTQRVKNLTETNGKTITLYAVWKESQTYLFSDLKPLENSRDNIKFKQTAEDGTGKVHSNVALLTFKSDPDTASSSERITGGIFSEIKGTIYPVLAKYMTENSKTVIIIYADGEKIYESSPMNIYSSPQSFKVNISGVNSIEIKIHDRNSWTGSNWYGDLMIEDLILVR